MSKKGHHSHVYYGLGVLAAFDDKHDEAIQFFGKAAKIKPDFVEAHYNLGVAYQKQLKVPEVIEAFYGNLGIFYASIGKIQLALDSFDRAIELDPNYEPALLNRKIVESSEEGDCLEKGVKSIEYYKDYALENRSYIQELVKEQGQANIQGSINEKP